MTLLGKQKNLQEQLNELKRYNYDFENLVFSGGGVKTGSFYGCLEVSMRSNFILLIKGTFVVSVLNITRT